MRAFAVKMIHLMRWDKPFGYFAFCGKLCGQQGLYLLVRLAAAFLQEFHGAGYGEIFFVLHRSSALTFFIPSLGWLASTVERVSFNQRSLIRSRLSDSSGGAIRRIPEPEKTDRLCEEPVGVWDCESSDHIKGCDGTCVHAAGSLAGVDG